MSTNQPEQGGGSSPTDASMGDNVAEDVQVPHDETDINELNKKIEELKKEETRLNRLAGAAEDRLETLTEEFAKLSQQEKDQLLTQPDLSTEPVELTKDGLKKIVNEKNPNRLEKFIDGILTKIQEIQEEIKKKESALRATNPELKKSIAPKEDGPPAWNRDMDVDYGIKGTELVGNASLTLLKERVDELFLWHDKEKIRNEYLAPYVPILQSSGMGKTKLLYELTNMFNTEGGDCRYILIVCTKNGNFQNKHKVFDHVVNFAEIAIGNAQAKFDCVQNELQRIVGSVDKRIVTKVVLLFDEAQNLLEGEDPEKEKTSFLFRCVRWWLRKRPAERNESQNKPDPKVVAVFAGTSSHLASYFSEPTTSSEFSRELAASDAFYTKGSRLYDPFYQFVTTGCLALYNHQAADNSQLTEYGRAVQYGRPMFAMYQREQKLQEKESSILKRMLVSEGKDDAMNWKELSLIAVIATRVQMDLISVKMASFLISRGYASLMEFQMVREVPDTGHSPGHGEYVAQMAYFPDPVLARLAMCMMDEQHSIGGIWGQKKEWWVEKAKDMFHNGFCRAPKGDAGELFAALYLLFRGDEIRKTHPGTYQTFSVPLEQWIKDMLEDKHTSRAGVSTGTDNQQDPLKTVAADQASTKAATLLLRDKLDDHASNKQKLIISSSVNFIQVCRNYMRYPFLKSMKEDDGRAMFKPEFLAYLYQSACAFYTYPNCPRIDLFGAILIRYSDGSEAYRPLLVSVKARKKFSCVQANEACKDMKKMCTRNRMGGLCLLVVFGGDDGCEAAGDHDTWTKQLNELDTKPIAVVIRLHGEGFYGLANTLDTMASDSRDAGEILSSSAYLRGHEANDFDDNDVLRAKSRDLQFLEAVRHDVSAWQGSGKRKRDGEPELAQPPASKLQKTS